MIAPNCTEKNCLAEGWRNLKHVEITSDDKVSRVSRADLFLKHIGRGMKFASVWARRLVIGFRYTLAV